MSVGVKASGESEYHYLWEEFRQLSKLDKSDEGLNEYFKAFMSMCKRTAGLIIHEKEGKLSNGYFEWFSSRGG